MIRVNKTTSIPSKLQGDGVSHAQALMDAYNSSSADYNSGKLKLEVKASIYGDKSVRKSSFTFIFHKYRTFLEVKNSAQ